MFRPKKCATTTGKISLTGQMKMGYSYSLLPVQFGGYKYNIMVISGKLRFNHSSYNPDGGTWSSPLKKGQQAHYDLTQGNAYMIEIVADNSLGNLDKVEIVNTSMLKRNSFYITHRKIRI